MPHSFPPKYAGGFLNSEEVQRELGVPLNITGLSTAVFSGMFRTYPVIVVDPKRLYLTAE